MKLQLLVLIIIILFRGNSFGQNCSAPAPTDSIPMNDLGTNTFTNAWGQVWMGGIYLNGSNYMPASHKSSGMQVAQSISPLDASGNLDLINGKIVWLSIGMSNTARETQQFIPLAKAYSNINPKLTFVNGAKPKQDAAIISSPWDTSYSAYWNSVNSELTAEGVTANQVQVIWFKEADANNVFNYTVQANYDSLLIQFTRIMHEIKARFPNAKLCYMASRTTARYATTNLNPEPYAYYTGYAVREIIQRQINGDTTLAFSGSASRSPFLLWGLYWWSNGNIPQITNPNIYLNCTDFEADGTHPSISSGVPKVADWLLTFYKKDTLSCPWFFDGSFNSLCENITGINETSYLNNFVSVYPNPFSSSAVFQFDRELTKATITVLNSYGEKIREISNFTGQTITFNRENLSAGIYYVQVTGEIISVKTKNIFIID